ncbi:MAG: hypothetical protein HYX46_06140 [Betaproteobacteria bacterium]|nr:hypothetical protein [Betaproteobacteria bacterium]
MKSIIASLAVTVVALAGFSVAAAADLKDRIKVEVQQVGLHPGMDPGMYVCASGHFHIKGTVQNLTSGALVGPIKVSGEAFDADGKRLGSATASTKRPFLGPNEKAEINLEFLTITGPTIQQVKKYDLGVVEAGRKP